MVLVDPSLIVLAPIPVESNRGFGFQNGATGIIRWIIFIALFIIFSIGINRLAPGPPPRLSCCK